VVIIAQTAYARKEDRAKALEAGCNDYISKPIIQTLLTQLVKKHFNNLRPV
jgi:CheY-like chemotaxis protein